MTNIISKNQIIEWVLCSIIAISWPLMYYIDYSDLKHGHGHYIPFANALSYILLISLIVWVINYIVKIPLTLLRQKDGILVPILWIVLPLLLIILLLMEQNTIIMLSVIILYNLWFCLFYGKKKIMWISLIMYNFMPWLFRAYYDYLYIQGWYELPSLIEGYSCTFFTAIAIGYLELFIRSVVHNHKTRVATVESGI